MPAWASCSGNRTLTGSAAAVADAHNSAIAARVNPPRSSRRPNHMLRAALIIAFLVYGIPLWRLRYRWRATVYRMPSWKINFLPWFGKDIAALFTNRFFANADELRMAARFRLYIAGYFALLVSILALR